jgi:SSS family solute:Na+ symporter
MGAKHYIKSFLLKLLKRNLTKYIMKNNILDIKDYIVFAVYFVIVAAYGLYIYKKKKSLSTGSKDYFLAEGSLTWWAIGASLIASNISAEQFIGMSGSGFKMGLAIATYEWMAAATLLVVAIFFIPVYLKIKYPRCRSIFIKGIMVQ